jgi:hypothetical protein
VDRLGFRAGADGRQEFLLEEEHGLSTAREMPGSDQKMDILDGMVSMDGYEFWLSRP